MTSGGDDLEQELRKPGLVPPGLLHLNACSKKQTGYYRS